MIRSHDTQRIAEILGGIPIWMVLPASPAERAGVRVGDIVLAVNGRATRTLDEYLLACDLDRAALRVTVFREGAEIELVVSITESTDVVRSNRPSSI